MSGRLADPRRPAGVASKLQFHSVRLGDDSNRLGGLPMVSPGSKRLLAFALLASALPVHAGELKGRILVGEKPMPGVTVTAVPYETPWAEARRQVRNLPAPASLASATSGPNGSFVLTVLAAPQDRARPEQDFQIRLEGGGIAATLLD